MTPVTIRPSSNHPSIIPRGENKKVIGMFKDEAGGKIIQGFVGLRAKHYVYKMLDGKEEKKFKGIRKCLIKKDISLFTGSEHSVQNVRRKGVKEVQRNKKASDQEGYKF